MHQRSSFLGILAIVILAVGVTFALCKNKALKTTLSPSHGAAYVSTLWNSDHLTVTVHEVRGSYYSWNGTTEEDKQLAIVTVYDNEKSPVQFLLEGDVTPAVDLVNNNYVVVNVHSIASHAPSVIAYILYRNTGEVTSVVSNQNGQFIASTNATDLVLLMQQDGSLVLSTTDATSNSPLPALSIATEGFTGSPIALDAAFSSTDESVVIKASGRLIEADSEGMYDRNLFYVYSKYSGEMVELGQFDAERIVWEDHDVFSLWLPNGDLAARFNLVNGNWTQN